MTKIKSCVKAFERCCSKHKAYGALDTEPDLVFQILISQASRGGRPEIPRTPTGWELLYADKPGCNRAAMDMHYAAWNVVEEIEACPIRDVNALRDFVREYCWRIG